MLSLALLASLAADPTLTRLREEDARVAIIAWRLQTANAPICPKTINLSGMSVQALSQYPKQQRAAATAQLGLDRHVAIAAIAPDSPADRMGLAVGDSIIAINGLETPIVSPDDGYEPVAKVEDSLDFVMVRPSIDLRIARAGIERDVKLSGQPGCPSRIQIIPDNSINAQADGRFVQINDAMLSFVLNDDELAVIIGHELAHNILRHIKLKTRSKTAEYQADRLGVWLMARAGYDVEAVVPFWTRFEKRTNAGIFAAGTHPSPKKRIAAVAKAVADLKAQRAAGQPLIPVAQ